MTFFSHSFWNILAGLLLLLWAAYQIYHLYLGRHQWKTNPYWSRRLLWSAGILVLLLAHWVRSA